MHPRNVRSPQDQVLAIIRFYIDPIDQYWSVAELLWYNRDGLPARNRIACRWNHDINIPTEKGNPTSRGYGTWFVLPEGTGMEDEARKLLDDHGVTP